MKSFRTAYMLLVTAALTLAGCKSSNSEEEQSAPDRIGYELQENYVDTITLCKTDFYREIISNGKLSGIKKAGLRFSASGVVSKVNVKNGDFVKQGSVLASLDDSSCRLSLENARKELERSELGLYDNLISNGYSADTSQVPAEYLRIAKIRSGYESALHNVRSSEINLYNTVLRAPFSGIVANVKMKPYETVTDCALTLIDNSAFDVTFTVLESELQFCRVGQTIRVSPFIDLSKAYQGVVTDINPTIDEKGQAVVNARIKNTDRFLIDGMNVKINLESARSMQLAVPKSAVVVRDGYNVVFLYDEESGEARWLYVDIIQSNSTHHVIAGCEKKHTEVTEGSIVITSGNMNLADGSKVKVR